MKQKNISPVLVIHGGASQKPAKKDEKTYVASLTPILEQAYEILKGGGSAREAVIAAVVGLEDDPLYNAGLGSKLQSDGKIRMSASVMDGFERRFGACVNVEGVRNPVLLAELLMNEKDRTLASEGARRFAREHGLKFRSPYTERARSRHAKLLKGLTGTVGAVALDSRGRLAAATSTGGRGMEYPHRVSDSPTTAGNFANEVCAVSATGVGEEIIEFAAAASLCAYVETGISLSKACRQLRQAADRKKSHFGWIALDNRGRFQCSATLGSRVLWAVADKNGFQINL